MRWRAHALVLVVVCGLVMPVGPVVGAQSADSLWDQGQQLMRRGEYAAAQQFYADLADRVEPAVAARALLLQARAAEADGDATTAEALVLQVVNDYPSSDQAASAYMTLEQVRRSAGDCSGALRALDAFENVAGRTAVGPYTAIQRAQCLHQLGDWTGELAAARAALSIEDGGPRLTRIEALERAAEAELKLGRKQDALDFYNRSLELAGTRAYKAEMLFTTATIAHGLGQDPLATERFRAVVVDYADQARAPGALDALVEMDRGGTVSPYQAGLVRLNGREYDRSMALFAQVDAASPDWGQAQLSRADALVKLDREPAALDVLQAIGDSGTPQAGAALLRRGQLQERDGDPAGAEATYLRVPNVAADRAAEALFHVGFTRYVRGDSAAALAAWQSGLASGPPAPALQAQLLYWSAKASPAATDASRAALTQAAAAAPETYYGLRAQEQLGTTLSMASSAPSSSTAWLALSAREVQERDAWYATFKLSAQKVTDDLARLPALQRADALLELGLRTEAGWEIDQVAQQYATAHDLAHLNGLADWLAARDLPQLTLRVGRQMRDLVGLSNLPRAAQKQVYPAAWGDLVAEQAAQHRVDPLLMLALMRQESSFDPRARSGAQAMGLTQVVPATARGIASRLGRDDFALRDLYKPAVSLEFGTWFLGQLLGEYKGRVFPALAAYNSGGGNVARWLQRFGDDPDVLVEQVPFAETQTYLRIVYDNFWHYRALYGERED
jgi:soluble lytic murein transglycosylase